MGSTVKNLDVNLRAKTDKFSPVLKKAGGEVAAFTSAVGGKLSGMAGSTKAALVGLGAATLTAAFSFGAMKKTIDDVSNLVDLSNRIGADVSEIQALDRVATLAGMSTEDMHSAMETLTRSAAQAAQGVAKPASALKELGIDAQEFNQMRLSDKMATLADAMEKIPNPGDKLRLLKSLRLDPKLLNSFEGGSAAIKEAMEQAEKFGQVLSQKNAAEIEHLGDSLQDLESSVQGFSTQLTAALAPAFSYMAEVASTAFNNLRNYLLGSQDSVENWGAFLKAKLQTAGLAWEIFKDTTALVFVQIYDNAVSVFARLGNELDRVIVRLTLKATLWKEVLAGNMTKQQMDFAYSVAEGAMDIGFDAKNVENDKESDLAKTLAEDLARHQKEYDKAFAAQFKANLEERPEEKKPNLPEGAKAPDKKISGSANLGLNEKGSAEAYETIAKAGNMRTAIEEKQLDVLEDIDEELASLNTTIAGWGVA